MDTGFDFAAQQAQYAPYVPAPEQVQPSYPVEQTQSAYSTNFAPAPEQTQTPYSSTATTFNPFGSSTTEVTVPEQEAPVPIPEVIKFHLGELGLPNDSLINYHENHPDLGTSNHIIQPDEVVFKKLGEAGGAGHTYYIVYNGVSVKYNSTVGRRTGNTPSTAIVGRFLYEPTPYGITDFEEYRKHAVTGRIIKIVSKGDKDKPDLKPRTTYFLVVELTPDSQIRLDIIGIYRTMVIACSDKNTSDLLNVKTALPNIRTFNESFSAMGNVNAAGGVRDPLVYKTEGKNIDTSKKGYPSLWIPLTWKTHANGEMKKSTRISTLDPEVYFDRPSDWANLKSFDMKVIPSITISCVKGDKDIATIAFSLDSCIAFDFVKSQGADSQADVKAYVAASGAKDETLDFLRALRSAQSESEKAELNFVNFTAGKAETTTAATPAVSTAVAAQQVPPQQAYYAAAAQQPGYFSQAPQGFIPQPMMGQQQMMPPQQFPGQQTLPPQPMMGQQQMMPPQQQQMMPPQQVFGQPQQPQMFVPQA